MKSKGLIAAIAGIACVGCLAATIAVGSITWIYLDRLRVEGSYARHMGATEECYRQGQYTQMLSEATAAVQLKPMEGMALSQRGRAYEALSDYNRAIADYNQALQYLKSPFDISKVYVNRATCWNMSGMPDRAIEDCNTAIRVSPATPYALATRGDAYFRQKDYNKALADLTQAITYDPNNGRVRVARAWIYAQKGDYAAAIPDQKKYLLSWPRDANQWGNLGWYEYQAGNLKAATENSAKAVALNPNLVFARFNLGLCLAVKGDTAHASSEYDMAIETARRTNRPGDVAAGIKDLQDALKRHPDSASVQSSLTKLRQASVR